MKIEVQGALKALRLSGILENLAIRNKEAIDNKMSFMEFLSTLLQDEVLRREQKKLDARIIRSKINCDKTLERFDFGFNPKINQQQIRDLATCHFIEEKVPMLIVGPCGTGKTHVAQAPYRPALCVMQLMLYFLRRPNCLLTCKRREQQAITIRNFKSLLKFRCW